ncbi:hypothetical protein Kfla_5979 [Kribbella flavida DSM 17836]|uniref:Uncharacterized protein n=1 Tax=Kribbella flavida (strain DSM 17836 / JCM 10339 / NBRC 14399) TaxID=479435 RepID=D2PST0_KRIFD|nr:hypothetical protein [Kribbella flavida]ADB34982.1 hypothetical protein Kfla_5979 [Kribbella flavida DSM 17836]
MKRNLYRAAAATAVLAAGTVVSVQPASAANDSWNAPRLNPERSTFCRTYSWWFEGFQMTGTSNNGTYGTWAISDIRDDPHQTAFDAAFYANGRITWVTWYC